MLRAIGAEGGESPDNSLALLSDLMKDREYVSPVWGTRRQQGATGGGERWRDAIVTDSTGKREPFI